MNPVRAKYKCTQQELYSIANTVYDNLENNLSDFASYKAKYDALFITALRDAVTAAQGNASSANITGKHVDLEIDLEPLADKCCKNFQLLKGYIVDAFDEAHHNNQFNAAGQGKYAPAASYNWEYVMGLNSDMKLYISENTSVLTTNGYMPAGFAAQVNADSVNFNGKYADFKNMRQTGVTTADRLTANNLIYDDMMKVCADGQRIFADIDEKKKLFVFDVVKALVSPPGSASLKVSLIKAGDNTPLTGKPVSIQAEGGVAKSGVSDDNGEVEFDNIDPGVYSGTVKDDTTVIAEFEKEVNTGTAARLVLTI